MDNAQKAIMIGVGLFLTILIITIVLLVTNLGILTTKDAADSVGTISETLKQQLVTQYDGKTITGQDVSFAISQYNGQLKNVIFVGYYATAGSTTVTYNTLTSNATPVLTPSTWTAAAGTGGSTPESVNVLTARVNLSGMYESFLVKDSSSNIIGLAFKPK